MYYSKKHVSIKKKCHFWYFRNSAFKADRMLIRFQTQYLIEITGGAISLQGNFNKKSILVLVCIYENIRNAQTEKHNIN